MTINDYISPMHAIYRKNYQCVAERIPPRIPVIKPTSFIGNNQRRENKKVQGNELNPNLGHRSQPRGKPVDSQCVVNLITYLLGNSLIAVAL